MKKSHVQKTKSALHSADMVLRLSAPLYRRKLWSNAIKTGGVLLFWLGLLFLTRPHRR